MGGEKVGCGLGILVVVFLTTELATSPLTSNSDLEK